MKTQGHDICMAAFAGHVADAGYMAAPGPPQAVVRGYPVADQPPPSGYGGGNGAHKV